MTRLSQHPAFLPLQGGINFRDMGGQRASDGREIRKGKLLRSGALHQVTPEDLTYLGTIPLSTVLDYRDASEVSRSPNRLSANARYINAPANPLTSDASAKITAFSADKLDEVDGEQYMLELYRQLPFNNPAYKQLARLLASPFDGALLQHCAVGKDRTGVGSALTLFTLGCDSATVMEEYLLTHGMLTHVEEEVLGFLGDGLSERARHNLSNLLTVRESYLGAALEAIHQRYPSIDVWLEQEYQLTPGVRAEIQSRLLAE